MNNIDNLLKDISIRHASKNVDKYIADVEKAIGIRLVPADNNSLEFTWSEDFEWFANVRDAK